MDGLFFILVWLTVTFICIHFGPSEDFGGAFFVRSCLIGGGVAVLVVYFFN